VVSDVLSAGPEGTGRRRPHRRLVAAAVVVCLVAGAVVAAVLRADRPHADAGAGDRPAEAGATVRGASPSGSPLACGTAAPASRTTGDAAAVVVGEGLHGASTLTRRDRTAVHGPWTVSVRAADGGFAHHGAVVTFPAAPSTAPGAADPHTVVRALAGAQVRVRGDLPRAQLLAVARATRVRDGRPVVRPPRGLTVLPAQPYRPGEVHEVRYEGSDLGQAGAVLGFVYTGFLRGGGVEDALYALGARPDSRVHGGPAYVTTLLGGSAALVWSPAPGSVAYVGYSGRSPDDTAVAALRCLASATTSLTAVEWRRTQPTVVDDGPLDLG
jgi:hypothetical protein